jgi:hypothetical protein
MRCLKEKKTISISLKRRRRIKSRWFSKIKILPCVYCEETLTPETVTIDHILPVSKGGTNDLSNLQPTCEPCNRAKGNNEGWTPAQVLAEREQILIRKYEGENLRLREVNHSLWANNCKLKEEFAMEREKFKVSNEGYTLLDKMLLCTGLMIVGGWIALEVLAASLLFIHTHIPFE